FFVQAGDGIRDFHVTGVQTCALPILSRRPLGPESGADLGTRRAVDAVVHRLPARSLPARRRTARRSGTGRPHAGESPRLAAGPEIGRASCREWWSVAGAPVPVTTD